VYFQQFENSSSTTSLRRYRREAKVKNRYDWLPTRKNDVELGQPGKPLCVVSFGLVFPNRTQFKQDLV